MEVGSHVHALSATILKDTDEAEEVPRTYPFLPGQIHG